MNPIVTAALAVTVIAVALTGWRALRGIEEMEEGCGRTRCSARPQLPPVSVMESFTADPSSRPQLSLIVGSVPSAGGFRRYPTGGRRHLPAVGRPSLHLVDPTPAA